jgi:hypothetical protein
MKNYDWNAEDYARHSAAQQDWARELIAKLHLQGTENILDSSSLNAFMMPGPDRGNWT